MSNIWTDSMLREEALKYRSRGEFTTFNKSAYEISRKRGILDVICKHMVYKHNRFTKESVLDIAKKYNSKTDFILAERSAYRFADRNGFTEELFSNMEVLEPNTLFTEFRGYSGIYILSNKDTIVYIGKSNSSVSHRLYSHYNNANIIFDTVNVHLIQNNSTINILEVYLIEKHSPIYNTQSKSDSKVIINIDNWGQYVDSSHEVACSHLMEVE